jgi:hypothetical protein
LLFEPTETDLLTHTLRTFGMFSLTGDPNQRHDVGQLPLLGWPLAALAVLGVLRLWRARREPAHALILWSLPIFLLPPLLATEGGAPHFLRSLGLAAPLAVTIGLGAPELVSFLRDRFGPMTSRAGALAVAVGLLAAAAGSGWAYLSRPVADRYEAYRFDLVALAAKASPADAVVLDDYSSTVVRFLDAGRLPDIVPPGSVIADPGNYGRVLALTRNDLLTALGPRGANSVVVERDPRGAASVWQWEP